MCQWTFLIRCHAMRILETTAEMVSTCVNISAYTVYANSPSAKPNFFQFLCRDGNIVVIVHN